MKSLLRLYSALAVLYRPFIDSRTYCGSDVEHRSRRIAGLCDLGGPNYSLESAYEIAGPWFPIPDATSGYTLAADQPQQYFRLSSQTINQSLLPVAANYSFAVLHDQTLSVSPPGVLQLDSDPSSLLTTAILASQPSYGTATIAPDGSLIYTPEAHFAGTDTFYYVLTDSVNVSTPGKLPLLLRTRSRWPSRRSMGWRRIPPSASPARVCCRMTTMPTVIPSALSHQW